MALRRLVQGRLDFAGPSLPLWIAAVATVGALALVVTMRLGSHREERAPSSPQPIEPNSAEDELPGPEGGTLAQLAWIVGTWRTVASTGRITEVHWSPSYHRSMTGTMRRLGADQEVEYAHVLLEESGDSVRMYLRHFERGSIAREEKTEPITLELDQLQRGKAVFRRPGVEFPMSIELSLDEAGRLCVLQQAFCTEGPLLLGECLDREVP